ncbi:MAG: M48 family metalloprotease, partial [Hyphomonadaceae bacterium]|nr:M48 family metalloprotease [Hyphomonadaceae bacterium]
MNGRAPFKAAHLAFGLAIGLALSAGLVLAQSRQPGQRPADKSVEASIWDLSHKAELEAKRAGQLMRDPGLNSYVSGIKCRVAPEYCADMRVYLMARPAFNASMAPNGYMEVWSGLLLRAENEAQVAFVIAHETGHFEEDHSIEAWVNTRSRANLALGLSIVAGVAGAPSYVGDLVYLGAIASIFSFSRENEKQADEIGFKRAVAAGYDPVQGGELWRLLMAETAASQFPAVRSREARSSIFNTHPISTVRATTLDNLARIANQTQIATANAPNTASKTWIVGRESHREAIRPFLSEWLRDELRRRDYGQTQYLITRLKSLNTDLGVLNFYEGELHRLRRQGDDLEKARAAYELAIT